MSFAFWFLGRQLREALKVGQPEEARRLLQPYLQARHRQALEWLPELVRSYVKRAQRSLSTDDAEAAWKDLLAAETLQAALPELTAMRSTLTKLGAAECRAALLAGKPLPVIDKLGRLQARGANHPEFPLYESLARDWVQTSEMAHRGDFAAALGHLDRMKQSLSDDLRQGFDPFERQLRERYDTFRTASAELYRAAEQSRWADVLQQADAVMAVAPEHREVRSLKERAWAVLQANSKIPVVLQDQFAATKAYEAEVSTEPVEETPLSAVLPKRFLLWIDGVGGYLVCLGNRVGFGHATVAAPVDVPLFADVSRLQAEMQRDAEGYGNQTLRAGQRRPRDPGQHLPVRVHATGPHQPHGTAGTGERASPASGGGWRAADGGEPDPRPHPTGACSHTGCHGQHRDLQKQGRPEPAHRGGVHGGSPEA
jgi:hypothetical protein